MIEASHRVFARWRLIFPRKSMSRSPHDLPSRGPNGGHLEKKNDKGDVVQRRYYDASGKAEKNIDYDHDYEGVGVPHAHDWDWTKLRPRQRARALKPGEI
jgi:hypothetical protein